MGLEHKKKTPYTPWANGIAENFMKNLGKVMQTAEEEKLNWRQELQRFLRAYRATLHSMTECLLLLYYSMIESTKLDFQPQAVRLYWFLRMKSESKTNLPKKR